MEQLTTTQLLQELNKRVVEEGYNVGLSNGLVVIEAKLKEPKPHKPIVIVKPTKEFYFDPLVMKEILSYMNPYAKVQKDIKIGYYFRNTYWRKEIYKVVRMTETSVWIEYIEEKNNGTIIKQTKRYKRRNDCVIMKKLNVVLRPNSRVDIFYTKQEWEIYKQKYDITNKWEGAS